MSLLIKNIGELFDGYRIIRNTSIYIEDGIIRSIGEKEPADEVIDAENKFVMPGFIDCHTHTVFSGYREFEVEWKIEGLTYQEISSRGGGIKYTVERTRKASKEQLKKEAIKRIDEMMKHGTTTLEIKSGYGLDLENEVKILRAINELDVPADVIPTFLVHAIPDDIENYVEYVVEEMIPYIGERGLARFCDVFCEKGYFNVEESRRILMEARKYGMLTKIHADEFSSIGCSIMASDIGVVSADHLLMAGEEEIRKMASSKVTAVLLPAVPFILNTPYPPANKMMRAGIDVALATDFNPNCFVMSMQFVVQLACYKMNMKPLDALKSATINSAKALKIESYVGSIEVGKKADILIMDVPSHLFIPYFIGKNMVKHVIKNGKLQK